MRKENKFWNKKTIIGFLTVLLMVSSSAGIMMARNNNDTLKYNNFKFNKINNRWVTKINGKETYFEYSPKQLESMSVPADLKKILDVDNAYMSFEVTRNLQYIDLIRLSFITSMEDNFNISILSGTTNKTDSYDFPIINCENATEEMPVIKFVKGNETKIYSEENCIIAEAQTESDFLAVSDRILYSLFGVI